MAKGNPGLKLGLRLIGCAALLSAGATAVCAAPAVWSESATATATASDYVMPETAVPAPVLPATTARELPLRVHGGDQAYRQRKAAAATASGAVAESPAADLVVVPDARAPSPDGTLAATCSTNVATQYAPSDIEGAAGRTNLVVTTNVEVAVYRKAGCSRLRSAGLNSFFAKAGVPATAVLFDPRVVYDGKIDRFAVTAESLDTRTGNNDQYQYLAVSKDGAGTSWWLYRWAVSVGTTKFCKMKAGDFWDYPSLGYSQGRWFITANDFPSGQSDSPTMETGAILSIDKSASLTGAPVTSRCFANLQINVAPPIVVDGASVATFLSPGGDAGSTIKRFNLTEAAGGASADTLSTIAPITVPSWIAAPSAVQPNGQKLDSLDGRFQSASIQAGSFLWNAHTIAVKGFAKARLYKLPTDAAKTKPLMTFTPTTDASAGADHLFNPSVATASANPKAPIFMTLSRTQPSAGAAGNAAHLLFEGPGNGSAAGWTFSVVGQSAAQFHYATKTGTTPTCNSSSRGSCRWGDYSSTQIDPVSPKFAWSFNQLVAGTSSNMTEWDWKTDAGKGSN